MKNKLLLFFAILLLLCQKGYSQTAFAYEVTGLCNGCLGSTADRNLLTQELCTDDRIAIEYENLPDEIQSVTFTQKGGGTIVITVGTPPTGFTAPVGTNGIGSITGGISGDQPLGSGSNFAGRIVLRIPDNAISGPVTFADASGNSFTYPFIIPNPDVDFGALPDPVCSEDEIPLIGTPAPGTFTVDRPSMPAASNNYFNTATAAPYQAIFMPNPGGATPSIILPSEYVVNATMTYTHSPTLSDGAVCRAITSTPFPFEIRDNRDIDITYNPSNGTTQDISAQLVNSVNLAGTATPSQVWAEFASGTAGIAAFYSGTYVASDAFIGGQADPSGNEVTLLLSNGGCTATTTGIINVTGAGTGTAIDSTGAGFLTTICSGGIPTTFEINRGDIINPSYVYDYSPPSNFLFFSCGASEFNKMTVSCTPFPGSIVTLNGTGGAESFRFDPLGAGGVAAPTTIEITIRLERLGSGGFFCTSPAIIEELKFEVDVLFPGTPSAPASLTPIPVFCNSDNIPKDLTIPAVSGITVVTINGINAGASVVLTPAQFTAFNPNTHNATYGDPSVNTDYRLDYTIGTGNCASTASFSFTIEADIATSFVGRHSLAPVNRYCEDEAPDLLTPFPLPSSGIGAAFIINGTDTISSGGGGLFDPASLGPNTYSVAYHFTSLNGCVQVPFVDILEVAALPPVSLSGTTGFFSGGTALAPEYCANQTNAGLTGAPATGGNYVGNYSGPTLLNPSDNTFDPNAIYGALGLDSIPGFVGFNYSVTDIVTGCQNRDSITVIINPFSRPTVFGFPADRQYCDKEILSPVTISAVDNFNPGGYLFTGDGVLQNPNFYHPDSAGIGIDTVVLTFTNLYNCQTIDTILITIDTIPRPIITNLPAIICIDDPVFLLAGSPAVGSGIASYFTGIGVVDGLSLVPPQPIGDYFYPDNAGTGLKEITYTYTDNNQCTGFVKDTIDVKQLPLARFIGLEPSYCVSSPVDILIPLDTSGTSFFSGAGITQSFGELTPSMAGLPGIKTVIYAYTDTFGCTGVDSQFYFLNALPIVGITGLDSAYCANGVNDIIQGSPAGSGGTFELIPGLAQIGFGQASFNPSSSPLSPTLIDIKYRFTDGNNCTDSITLQTEVFPPPSPSIIGLAAQYCETQDTFYITGLPAGGAFTGPGTTIGQNTFMPFRAGSGAHTVSYSVTDTFVPTLAPASSLYCTAVETQAVTVNPLPNPFIASPINNASFCENEPPQRIYGSVNNTALLADSTYHGVGVLDSVVLVPVFVPGLGTVLLADTIGVFAPAVAGPGVHSATYIATNTFGCVDSVRHAYTVYAVPQPGFFIDSVFCESDPPVFLSGTPTGGIFSLNGTPMTTNVYYPNPGYPNTLLTSQIVDTLIYTASNAQCVASDTNYVLVNPNPVVTYQAFDQGVITNQACLGQDTLNLVPNILGGTFSGSGVLFGSSNFIANVSGVGAHQVKYEYTDSTTNCSDLYLDTFYVYSTPNVSFAIEGGCGDTSIIFLPDNGVLGLNGNFLGNLFDSITTIQWTLGDGAVRNELPIGNQNQVDTLHHLYLNPGIYNAILFVENQNYCSGADTVRVIVSPAASPTPSNPYFENFNTTNGGWFEEAEVGNQSSNLWAWNFATGTRIKTLTDTAHYQVWVTNPSGAYGQNASGWVYSPCFDLTTLDRPMIRFDYYNDTDPGNDGVVVEYYNHTYQEWLPLGEAARGINWYNYNVIAGRPGIQDLAPKGWSGINNSWKDGRYKLDDFKSYPDFRFRIAFGAVGVSTQGLEGFAFDNVWIGNRTRNVLLEHFSNEGFEPSGTMSFDDMNQYVYNLIYTTPLVQDVVLVQYNTKEPEYDEFNEDNQADPSARRLYYGLTSGKSVIDGIRYGAGGSASISLAQTDFEYDMLESPKFDIELNPAQILNGIVQVQATITANENMPLDDYFLRILVVEDSMTYASGEQVHSLMRKMMPDADGKYFQQSWTIGQSDTAYVTWNFNTTDYNEQNMSIIAFVQRGTQDHGFKEVYQVVSTRDISSYTVGTDEVEEVIATSQEVSNMNLYPNPARDIVNIEFDTPLSQDYDWSVVDLQGRVLRNGILRAGEQKMAIESYDWASGMYVFVIREPRFKVYRKFVIVND